MKALILIQICLFISINFLAGQSTPSSFNRLIAEGDFNGDGKIDKLKEAYINQITKGEIFKINFENCNSRDCVDNFFSTNSPRSYLIPIGINDTLFLSFGEKAYPTFGITGLLNIGNVNEHKGDEIAVVVGWADYSSVTRCQIWTYEHDEWKVIEEFLIHEDQIHDNSNSKTILLKKDKSLNSKGIFYLDKEGIYIYEYDAVNGKIVEKEIKTASN